MALQYTSENIEKGQAPPQVLFVNKSKRRITGSIQIFLINDGKFKLAYIPALDLTGYGKTYDESEAMLKEVLDDYFQSLINLKLDDIRKHLLKHGWSTKYFKKQYENTNKLDKKGVLRQLELPDNTRIRESFLKVA